VNDYILEVAATLIAAGLYVKHTATVAHGRDHILDVDSDTGSLELVWNETYGWIILRLAEGLRSKGRAWQHNLATDADPGAVVHEVKRALAEQTGSRR
jgi:hypothetical protein